MCGIVGYYCKEGNEASQQAMYALYAQQHRGQEASGITVTNGKNLHLHKGMG